MFSGGEIKFDPNRYKVQDTNRDRTINEDELKAGLRNDDGSNVSDIKDTDLVRYKGKNIPWGILKKEVFTVRAGGRWRPGRNEGPLDILKRNVPNLKSEGEQLAADIEILKKAKADGKETIKLNGADVSKGDFDAKIESFTQRLQNIVKMLKASNTAQDKSADEGIPDKFLKHAGIAKSDSQQGTGKGNGNRNFRASQAGGAGTNTNGANAAAPQGANAPYNAAAYPNFSSGWTPQSSAAYANALYMDGAISDGIGSINNSRQEGRKLMMLLMYFMRMASTGDLGAMYQLIKFITYIIAKDKANQNIQISGKLIELQDLSRKATETLLKQPTDGNDTKQQNDFMKALHKAKSDEASISTSQKLLADMLQEFAHVVEALTNSTKYLLDAWGRVLRTATRP